MRAQGSRWIAWSAALVVMVIGAIGGLSRLWLSPGLPDGLIQANGRIEGDHVTVASKFPGRVEDLLVREGDSVEAGQVLIRLDDVQARARVEQATQAFASFEAKVQAAHTELAVLNLDVPLAIEAADAQVVKAKAMVERALAVEREARSDARRFRELAEKDQASRQQRDQADLKWQVSQREITAARSALEQAVKQAAQAELGWKKVRAKEAEVAALVDLDRLYLQVYVPEVQSGKLRLGLPAKLYVDAYPDQGFDAAVRYIASKAEFTPKEVQTPDERVKLIYAVKLYLQNNPDRRLTPGLPADAVIRWRDDVAWAKPRT